jgi:SAM-dependent methyltransferase
VAATEALAGRNRYDGVAVAALNDEQAAARDRVLTRLESGEYELEEVACPDCGRRNGVPVAEKERHGLPMRVVACAGCGLVYTSPRLSEPSLERFYERDAYELDRGSAPRGALFAIEREKGHRIAGFLEGAGLAGRVRGVVVEIGCGAGGILDVFRERGHAVLGCDLSPECVAFARDRGVDVHKGSVEAVARILGERGERAGLIIYEQVLEHLASPKDELHSAGSLLADSGLLYVGVPGLRDVDEHYGSDLLQYLEIDHLVHFDLDSLTRIACDAGFARIVGDEQVRAVFEQASGGLKPASGGLERTVSFLRALERRRRLKSLARTPARGTRWARQWLRLTANGARRRLRSR